MMNLVTGLEPEREHGEVERGGTGSRAAPPRASYLAGRAQARGFELLDLRAHREHSALEDLAHLVELRLPGVRPAETDVRTAVAELRDGRGSLCAVPGDRLHESFVELDAGSQPSTSRAFSTFGMRSSTSA